MIGMVHKRLVATHYYGGKFYLLPYLLKVIPNHHCYVEVFGGGGYLLLNKKRSRVEVYNDINGDVVNLFKVLRDNGDELIRRLKYTPYSRRLVEEIRTKTEFSDDIERAWVYFILLNQTFNAKGRISGFAYGRVKNHASVFKSIVDKLNAIVERLRGVVIENLDWRECVERYESENTFFYMDPPYPSETRKDKIVYEYEFTRKDHIKLRDHIKHLSSKVCLSTYPSDIYEELADAGWYKLEIKVSKWSRVLRKEQKGNKKSRAIEVLWMNYEPPQKKISLEKWMPSQ